MNPNDVQAMLDSAVRNAQIVAIDAAQTSAKAASVLQAALVAADTHRQSLAQIPVPEPVADPPAKGQGE